MCARLKQEFSAMTEESLSTKQCASNLLWAEQGSEISQLGGYRHVNSPKLSQFQDTYYACMIFLFNLFYFLVEPWPRVEPWRPWLGRTLAW